jgi:drug/metabolite transporter (DMT)-like permease
MTQEAIFWTLLATILAGIHLTIGKVTAQKKINSSLNSVITFLFSTLILSFFLFLQGLNINSNINTIFLLCTIAGFVYGISFILRIQALHHIDSVLFFPINKIIGPIIAIFGGIFLFGETLTKTQFLGVILSVSVPLLLINNTEKHRQKNLFLGLVLLFVSTVFGVSQQISLKYILSAYVLKVPELDSFISYGKKFVSKGTSLFRIAKTTPIEPSSHDPMH